MEPVLNAGYVRLVEWMGGDNAVIRNARRCWRSEDKWSYDANQKLIRHLLQKQHMTPFEAMVFTFDVKVPLFVARQWFRHRIGSYNEESLRYCIAEKEYYIPSSLSSTAYDDWKQDMEGQWNSYNYFIKAGLPKEQARALLPMGTYTKFYWTVNGSSLLNFLRLRLDAAAQAEIREYAQRILLLAQDIAPITFKEWRALHDREQILPPN